ncbi:MAG: NAD(P)/FAD-dependent oxidoreductase [Thermodesulfobacteriota bacterium]
MKVTVIGASLAGLFLAHSLAKEGVEVEVYEQRDRLGWPPRTLIVTHKLKEVLGFNPEEAILNKVEYMEIFSQAKAVKLKLGHPDLVVERGRLIELLAGRAKEVGAKIILNHQYESFIYLGKRILVNVKDLETKEQKKITTDILVGADGFKSAVAQGIKENGYYAAALLQGKVSIPQKIDPGVCQVWLAPQRIKYFYWLIPESSSLATVGLIADHFHQAKEGLEVFLKENKLDPWEFQQARVPLHRWGWLRSGKVLGKNIFLVGDAAAQVKVTTVGGVVPGLCGAQALAQALLNGRNYGRELKSLNKELTLHLLVRKILNQFQDEDYDELVSLIKGETKEILEKWTRDELQVSFLKLLFHEPRLLSLGLKAFWRALS